MKFLKNLFSIPNVLSFARIFLIPFIIISFLSGKIYLASLFIVLSAFTDIVDGFIARRFNMITPLGKALDPIADKLTLFTVLFLLCIRNYLVFWLLALFAIKEILMGIEGIIIIKLTGTTYSAKWFGKASTVIFYLSILTMILWTNIPTFMIIALLVACGFSVVFSFVFYTVLNVKKIMQIKRLN